MPSDRLPKGQQRAWLDAIAGGDKTVLPAGSIPTPPRRTASSNAVRNFRSERCIIESTFSRFNRKFGDSLRSKTDTARVNESLEKLVAHNLVVIHEMYELGIETVSRHARSKGTGRETFSSPPHVDRTPICRRKSVETSGVLAPADLLICTCFLYHLTTPTDLWIFVDVGAELLENRETRRFNVQAKEKDMARLVCDQVTQGLRPSERTVAVKDIHGRKVFLRVEEAFLTQENGKYWLPVGKVHEDKQREIALIELPQEAESGVNRLWVRFSDLLEYANRAHA